MFASMKIRWSKIILLFTVVILTAWLVFSPSDSERKYNNINQGLQNGLFYKIDSTDRQVLLNTIKRLCLAAGVKDSVVLNEPFTDQNRTALHFFISTPAAAGITNCEKGNAVFDAGIKSVFVDSSIVMPGDWLYSAIPWDLNPDQPQRFQLIEDMIPFNGIYVNFIILHELGHYKMHSQSSGYFDYTGNLHDKHQEKEIQADSFALSRLLAYYKEEDQFGRSVSNNIGVNIGLYGNKMPLRSKPYAGLIEMAEMTVKGKLLGVAPYSPYYKDAQHPEYIIRQENMIDAVLKDKDLNDTVRQKAAYVKAELELYHHLPSVPEVEIITPEPVLSACFGNKEILLTYMRAKTSSNYYKIPLDKLNTLLTDSFFNSYTLTGNEIFKGGDNADTNMVTDLWSSASHGFINIPVQGEMYILQGNVWKSSNLYLPPGLSNNLLCVLSPPQPAAYIGGVSNDVYKFQNGQNSLVKNRTLYSFNGISCKGEIDKQQIEAAIKHNTTIIPGQINLNNISIIEANAYVPFSCEPTADSVIWGMAEVNMNDMNVTSVSIFNTQNIHPSTYMQHGFITISLNNTATTFLVQKDEPERHSYSENWSVYQLSAKSAPVKIGSYPFTYSRMHDYHVELLFTYWSDPLLGEYGVRWLPPGNLVVNWDNDSMFLMDLNTRQAKVVFLPGGFNVHTGTCGLMAAFTPGTNRVWVIHP